MIFRDGQVEDSPAISQVLARSWKTAYRGLVNDPYLDALPETHWVDFLRQGLAEGSLFARVADCEAKITGAALWLPTQTPGQACLLSLYLLPDKIGQGLGHALYANTEAELVRRGFTSCVLDVLKNNGRAIRFYEAHGFVPLQKTISVTLGEESYSCQMYEKSL